MNCRLTPCQAALLRGLRTLLETLAGTEFEDWSIVIEQVRSDDWASLTFRGQRHELTLRLMLPTAAISDLADRLRAQAEMAPPAVPGGFVADMTFGVRTGLAEEIFLDVEALTLQE
jgi:hypothetical protein